MLDIIRDKKLFIFDIDGTISLDNRLFEKTKDVFLKLNSQNKHIYMVTNNSSKLPSHYIGNLEKAGLDTDNINLISSIDTALDYLKSTKMSKIYWAANKAVSAYIKENGFIFCDKNPDCLLLTYDTELNYTKLLKITELLHKNTPYFVTHTDFVCPTDLGYYVPDVGSFMALIKEATGKSPDKSFGKPERYCIDKALEETGLTEKDTIVIGDRLYTDIELGNRAGITSLLVLSGETTMEMYEKSQIKADIVLSGINELYEYL
ncbi:MAG: HAD-IIA family hydrolase [Defluviitaleaceae bacterium]|nr:HAD-IIA family hydrolase [Defluviitaleaceae bacterium]